LLNVPVALFTAGWLPLLAEIIPLQRRARVFSSRSITLGITVTICTFLFGSWLDRAPFPFNYQLLYALAVVTSSLSTVYVARIAMPDSAVAAPTKRQPLSRKLLDELLGTQALALTLGVLRLLGAALFVLNPVRSEAHHELYAARRHP